MAEPGRFVSGILPGTKVSSLMFHKNVSLSSGVGAAHGQHFDDDTPRRRGLPLVGHSRG